MSIAEEKQTTIYRCPACAGGMEEWDTICANCRSDLQAAVFAVRADDYPAPARAAPTRTDRTPQHVEPDAEAVDTNSEAMVAAVDDADLVPLAPIDDDRRPSPPPPSTPLVVRPPATIPVIHDSTSALQPRNRWKHIILAVVALLLTAVLAALLWSYVVPASAKEGQSSVESSPPTTRQSR